MLALISNQDLNNQLNTIRISKAETEADMDDMQRQLTELANDFKESERIREELLLRNEELEAACHHAERTNLELGSQMENGLHGLDQANETARMVCSE